MRILGIDPGTVSFDICLLDDDKVTFEDSMPSSVVAERPEELAVKCLLLKPKKSHIDWTHYGVRSMTCCSNIRSGITFGDRSED